MWNNYGLTEFNPCDHQVTLKRQADEGVAEVVNVTTTEGGRQEVRHKNLYTAVINVSQTASYSLLLDVGQKMARRHNLSIDGKTVIELQNPWLPPTASAIVTLTSGRHTLTAELTEHDQPVLYYQPVSSETVLRSPVADAVDYTVFVGSPDEIIATYRELTGKAPLMPRWALGYIHCRERFHSQDEILQTADRFRREQLPVSMLVQDWQYWGKYGWNSMQFDEDYYPDPKALTDSLHHMDIRLMLSVWSKIDRQSDVGRQMVSAGYYIDGTDWIDFLIRTLLLPTGSIFLNAWCRWALMPGGRMLPNPRTMTWQAAVSMAGAGVASRCVTSIRCWLTRPSMKDCAAVGQLNAP